MDKSDIGRLLLRCVRRDIYDEVFPFIKRDSSTTPSLLIHRGYNELANRNGNRNGDIFEALFLAGLIASGVRHILLGVSYSALPYSSIDAVIYTRNSGVVMISLKSSLRERWKQNDLEFGVVKHTQPRAFCALATMDSKGCRHPIGLLEEGKLLGLDLVVDCNLPSNMESLIDSIAQREPVEAYSDDLLGLTKFKAYID